MPRSPTRGRWPGCSDHRHQRSGSSDRVRLGQRGNAPKRYASVGGSRLLVRPAAADRQHRVDSRRDSCHERCRRTLERAAPPGVAPGEDSVPSLAEVLSGAVRGRESDEQITVFGRFAGHAPGVVWTALAAEVHARARVAQLGASIPVEWLLQGKPSGPARSTESVS